MSEKVYNGEDFLDSFIDKLIVEMRSANMAHDVLSQLKMDMKDSLDRRINRAILEHLPERKFDEFDRLLDRDTDGKKIQAFIRKNVPNMDGIISATLADFRREYIKK